MSNIRDTIGILGQDKPAATTSTALYTVPTGSSATCSTLVCCNQTGSGEAIRVSVAVEGATLSTEQYLYYDKTVPANDSLFLTIGITLSDADVLRVYSASGGISFNLFGVETS